MKRTLLSVKELAEELGISTDSVYRAYRKGEIPAAQICRMIRFDLEKVQGAMEQKTKAMPNKPVFKTARTAKTPRTVKRGRSWQMVGQEISINDPGS